jgi:hypothetical protein
VEIAKELNEKFGYLRHNKKSIIALVRDEE